MIQRIQSIYLLVVVILSCVTLFSPWANFISEGGVYEFNYAGLRDTEGGQVFFSSLALTILAAAIPVLALISIFLYRKRILQIRLTIFNLLLLVGFYILFMLYFYTIYRTGMKMSKLHITIAFPLVNIILTYLAIRAIEKDETLVRSFDRLR